MKVKIKSKEKIVIVPETDFEEEFLRDASFNRCWLKYTEDELYGLVIERREGASGP